MASSLKASAREHEVNVVTKTRWLGVAIATLLLLIPAEARAGDTPTRPPNVVIFIMDDVGMGDVGCFGNDTIKTPNIDRLASEGVKLTQHMAQPVCTPSRAALMTGRLPVRYGLAGKWTSTFLYMSAPAGMPSDEITVAELLKSAGYATAMIGKWHLGVTCTGDACSDPNSQGFDYFYGLPVTNFRDCGSDNTIYSARTHMVYAAFISSAVAPLACLILLKWMKVISWKVFVFAMILALIARNGIALIYYKALFVNCALMENREIVEFPLRFDHLTERLHGRAIQFMERHQDRPFLLVMSFVQAHTALFNNDQFRQHSVHGRYGDNLEEMDWSVGEVLASLRQLDLEGHTFVYLTSDNGGHVEEFTDEGERHGGWNGIYKGGKGSTWEGGIRVPALIKLPGVIPSGSVVSQPTQMADVLPTVARVTGLQLPDDRVYDGRDLLPLLTNKSGTTGEFMFHYCGASINAVRYTPTGGDSTYKLHYATVRLVPGPHGVMGCHNTVSCECRGPSVDLHDPPLVYDITGDPTEASPLDSDNPHVQAIVQKVEEAVSSHRATIATQQTDQLGFLQMLPRPWNRPRCAKRPFYFPYCTDPYLDQLKSMKKTTNK